MDMDDELHIEILKKMTPEEKLKAAAMLIESSCRLKFAALRKEFPDLLEEAI
jgi:hypothetical protein